MKHHGPVTPEEWREVVDAAAACRAIYDCKCYGLIEGGAEINVARCDYILENGAKLGYRPSKSAIDLGIEMIAEYNAGVASQIEVAPQTEVDR